MEASSSPEPHPLSSVTIYDVYMLHKASWFYMYLFCVFNYTGNAGIDKCSSGKTEVCQRDRVSTEQVSKNNLTTEIIVNFSVG